MTCTTQFKNLARKKKATAGLFFYRNKISRALQVYPLSLQRIRSPDTMRVKKQWLTCSESGCKIHCLFEDWNIFPYSFFAEWIVIPAPSFLLNFIFRLLFFQKQSNFIETWVVDSELKWYRQLLVVCNYNFKSGDNLSGDRNVESELIWDHYSL